VLVDVRLVAAVTVVFSICDILYYLRSAELHGSASYGLFGFLAHPLYITISRQDAGLCFTEGLRR
jgi:hypothetical protein